MSKVVGERGHHLHLARVESLHRGAIIQIMRRANQRIFSQHSHGYRAAEIGVECLAIAMIVRGRILRLLLIDAAAQHTRRAHAG